MSADWFCKINDKKIGPLNGQQLKTVVANGQLRPEHLVRRGSEGPWVPAGRIKGLFPEGSAGGQANGGKLPPAVAKPLGKAVAKPIGPPKAKAASLPTASEAPAPPVADLPQEFTLGGHEKHQQLNVEGFDYGTAPVAASRRKAKSGMKALRRDEQKKVTTVLLCLIGGGMTFGLAVMIWAVATGKFSGPKQEAPKDPMAAVDAADSSRFPRDTGDKKSPAAAETVNWMLANIQETSVGNVKVKVLGPSRGAPPKGAKLEERDVLIVPVNLSLADGSKDPVALTSWADAALKKSVSLTDVDDPKNNIALLDQVAGAGGESKVIPPDGRIQVLLIFQAPTNPNLKMLHLKLPPAAFHGQGPMICYGISASDIKAAQPDKAVKSEAVSSDVAKPDAAKPETGRSGVASKSGDK
jgi:hypothetical protein